MSGVSLMHLLEKDKNFYGLLDGALNEIFPISLGSCFDTFPNEKAEEYLNQANGKTLLELASSDINFPEWYLRRDGKLCNSGLYEVKKDGK